MQMRFISLIKNSWRHNVACNSFITAMNSIQQLIAGILIRTSNKYVTGFTKTVPISTRNEVQFIADY